MEQDVGRLEITMIELASCVARSANNGNRDAASESSWRRYFCAGKMKFGITLVRAPRETADLVR